MALFRLSDEARAAVELLLPGPLRRSLRQASAVPVIIGRSNRKRQLRYDRERYRGRRLIENAFCRLEDFQRVARCDKLARNYPPGVEGAVALAFWM